MAPRKVKAKAGRKRKFADPVAAAAMDALSSSDDDVPIITRKKKPASASNSSKKKRVSKGSTKSSRRQLKPLNAVSAASMDAPSSSDDDAPIIVTRKKKASASNSAKKKPDIKGNTKSSRRHLKPQKPLYEVGEEVYAAWWPNKKSKRDNLCSSWFPGIVKAYREEITDSPYGPTRTYDIVYDDGDAFDDVDDHYVFPKTDYILSMKNDGKSVWIGVANVIDSDATDTWAHYVGWYVATIDGEERPFSLLSDAMDAYDASVVAKRTRKGIKPSELNRPEKWSWLFENSDAEGGSEDDRAERKRKRRRKSASKDCQTDVNFQSLERDDSGKRAPPTLPKKEPSPEKVQNLDESASPSKHRKKSVSAYTGVSYSKQDRKYLAQIDHDGKLHCLGYYKFEADAALAIDKGSMLGSCCEQSNFSTRKEYENAIQMEMEAAGHRIDVVESYGAVVEKVGVYISKIYAAKNNVADAELGNKNTNDDSDGDEEMSVTSDSQNSKISRQHGNPNNNTGSRRKKGKFHDYAGVRYNTKMDKFRSCIICKVKSKPKKTQWLGSYKLEADAALAHDEALRLLKIPKGTNFSTIQAYENAKLHELERTGFGMDDAMSSAAIVSKVTEIMSKAHPSSVNVTSPKRGNRDSKRKSTTESKSQNTTADDAALDDNKTEEDPDEGLDMSVASGSPTPNTSTGDECNPKDGQYGKNNNTPSQRKKRQSSDYVGVSYHTRNKNWLSYIYNHDKSKIHLGVYPLEADAALAHDEAIRLLKIPEKTNFSTIQEYENAKLHELEITGLGMDDAMSSAAIVLKVTEIISNALPSSVNVTSPKRGNHDSAEKSTTESKSQNTTADDAALDDNKTDEASNGNLDMSVASDSPTPTTSTGDECNPKDGTYGNNNTIPPRRKMKQSSDYAGVAYSKRSKKWASYILHDKSKINLSHYALEADAALSYDAAARLLKIPEKTNFATLQDYEDAKLHELEITGLGMDDAMSSAAIVFKVTEFISKHRPSSVNVTSPNRNSEDPISIAAREPSDNHDSKKAPVMESKCQSKHSTFTGATYVKRSRTYSAQIAHNRKKHFLGYYTLETDAAMAYSEAAKLLKGADSSKVNFASRQDYTDARAKELKKTGFITRASIETLAEIATKIQKYLSKIPCPEVSFINDAMAEKWARYLPSETGKEFLDSYQNNINDVLGYAKLQRSELDISAPSIISDKQDNIHAADVEIESVQGKNRDSFFKPIAEGNTDDSPSKSSRNRDVPNNRSTQLHIHPEPEDDSDDDASLFSHSEENDTEETNILPDTNSTAIVRATDVSDARSLDHDNGSIIKLPDRIKEFPIGCPVMWHFDCNSFRSGMVTSPPIYGTNKDTAYEVMPTKSSGEHESITLVPGKALAFGLDCPVYVSRGSESHLLQGKILFCKTGSSSTNDSQADSCSYTILIIKEGNQFQVLKDIPLDRIKYRKDINKNTASADRGSGVIHNEVPSQAKKTSTSGLAPAIFNSRNKTAEENDSQASSQKFFSSNSTITSIDSAPASSRRAIVDGTSGRDGRSSVL